VLEKNANQEFNWFSRDMVKELVEEDDDEWFKQWYK
jgi:hypothetical protein